MNSPPRLAIIVSHPIQYYSPWFRWLRQNTSLTFKVFYLWEFGVTEKRDPRFAAAFKWDVDLLSGYESEFVPNQSASPGAENFRGFDNPSLCTRLAEWNPGAILLFGYNWLSHQRALWWARAQGIPLIFRGDSHFLGRGPLPLRKRLLLRFLYRQFEAITYVGTANHNYFRSLGVPDDRLFFSPHSVDAARFQASELIAGIAAGSLRTALGLDGKRIVLFAGKFEAAKQPVALLEAFIQIAAPHTALVFVGDGAEKDRLKALAAAHPAASVTFLPFANQTEMPARYLLAHIFALPSRGHYETWGLAVNEAMHLGVPCLVSDLVGCQTDLVHSGETGWAFRADDSAALLATLRAALETPADDLRRLGQNARARIAHYTYQQTTEGLLRALAGPEVR
ncbi:MAG: glycosyltransferase family 4 protein [Lacunisphaera sp.]